MCDWGDIVTQGITQHPEELHLRIVALDPDRGCLYEAGDSAKICKRFFQPKVIPPLHGYQVTKPHVGKLMERHKLIKRGYISGLLIARLYQPIIPCDSTCILHSRDAELRAEDLIILGEGEWHTK